MPSRRDFLQMGALASGSLLLPKWEGWALGSPTPILDPTDIPKYVTSLLIPPAMPKSPLNQFDRSADWYDIALRQFSQQILPTRTLSGRRLPATRIWGYGSYFHPGTNSLPAYTVEATCDRPVRIRWMNQLLDHRGRYLPHLLLVDPTLHWANPGGGVAGRDSMPEFTSTPGFYTGPIPMVSHVHGAHTTQDSDGYPEAWFLPPAANIPHEYARIGSYYDRFRHEFESRHSGVLTRWLPGSAVFEYRNDQRPTTLWYHDHTLGLTRVNVYAGPAGFYMIRGGAFDLPPGVLPGTAARTSHPGSRSFEIPIVIQDRSFYADGSLFYPNSRLFFDDYDGDEGYIPDTDVPPYWNPEFFPNTLITNGNTWPVLNVEPRRYRLRFLNACQSRFLILKVVSDPLAPRPASPVLPLWQIGSDGGFLPAPVQQDYLLVAPAERADVILDFSRIHAGTALYLINEGPDEPYGGGYLTDPDFGYANPHTTGQVMKFVVGRLSSHDTSVSPDTLTLPSLPTIGEPTVVRQVSLNESTSELGDFPIRAQLGTVASDGTGAPLRWMDPVTENPAAGSTEIWEIHNFTEDGHPIHVHLVQFEILDRRPFGGEARPPEANEHGTKDTVAAYPGETTRIKARFDTRGRFVWHCHILEHEDNEMMRPYEVE